MNMKVNETHCNTLIEDSMEEPLLTQLVKLVSSYAWISGVYTKKETHWFTIPPFGGFSPPGKHFLNSIESLTPYESSYHVVLILMDFYWFTDELWHCIDSKREKGDTIIVEHMSYCQEDFVIKLTAPLSFWALKNYLHISQSILHCGSWNDCYRL